MHTGEDKSNYFSKIKISAAQGERIRSTCSIGLIILLISLIFWRAALALQLPEWGFDERRYLEDAYKIWKSSPEKLWHTQQLYSLFISPAFYFSDSYFAATKILNVAILCLGLTALYSICRNILSRQTSILVIILSTISAQNTILGHAMTEPMIFAVYWTWLLCLMKAEGLILSAAAGVLGAVALYSSIKFIPIWWVWSGIFVFIRFQGKALAEQKWLNVSYFGCFVLAFSAIKFFSWPNNNYYLGYENFHQRFLDFIDVFEHRPREIFDMLCVHLGSALLPFAFGIGAAYAAFHKSRTSQSNESQLAFIFGFSGFAVAFAMSLYFTISVSKHEAILGLAQARYYAFALPIFLVAAFYFDGLSTPGRVFLVGITLLAVVAAWYTSYSELSSAYPWPSIENAELWHRSNPHRHDQVILLFAAIGLLAIRAPTLLLKAVFIIAFALNALGANRGATMAMGGFDSRKMPACAVLKQRYTSRGDSVALAGLDRVPVEASAIIPPFNASVFDWPPKNAIFVNIDSLDAAKGTKELNSFQYLIISKPPNTIAGAIHFDDCAILHLRD